MCVLLLDNKMGLLLGQGVSWGGLGLGKAGGLLHGGPKQAAV